MKMELKTFRTLRTTYYIGILLLILNTLPQSQKYLGVIFNKDVFSGMTVIMLIALIVAFGALMAFNRKL
jgi:hypothetical protein